MPDQKISYPRSRDETSAPLTAEELVPLLHDYWLHKVLDIQPARSRRVHYVQWPHRRVMVRVNPGWDGPTPPQLLVQFVNHTARQGAPAPAIIPTRDGSLFLAHDDQIISVETCIPGDTANNIVLPGFIELGSRLAQLHLAAETFPLAPRKLRPVGHYVKASFDRAMTRSIGREEIKAVATLRRQIEQEYADLLSEEIPWLMCRGDVRDANTIITPNAQVWFTDFDSAQYAPALYDVVMSRVQWSLNPQYELLTLSKMADLVRGYDAVRSLTESEWNSFPIVWASYYTDRMTFLFHRRLQGTRREDIERLRVHVLNLPHRAMALGNEIVDMTIAALTEGS